jgi:ABC-2 type transport system permease protein
MPTRSPLFLLFRDELLGYARSKVMLVLWFLMPAIAIIGYLALPAAFTARTSSGFSISATMFMSALTSSLSGTIVAVMIAVDIVSERNRKVFDLFVIRPMRRDSILWSKFFAASACVAVACIIAVAAGLAVDVVLSSAPSARSIHDLGKALVLLAGVIALSAAGGVFFGILSRGSIVAAVILVIQLVGFFQYLPLLPGVLGVLPDQFWLWMLASFAVAGLLVHAAAVMFRRAEL